MGWFTKKEVDFRKLLMAEKKIKIDGIPFVIRKIEVLDYLEGARVLTETFGTYKTGNEKSLASDIDVNNIKKIKKYLTDVICAGVVKPKFTREDTSDDPNIIPIKELFTDWQLAQKISQEIFEYTNGKKK